MTTLIIVVTNNYNYCYIYILLMLLLLRNMGCKTQHNVRSTYHYRHCRLTMQIILMLSLKKLILL